jgi:uncharacterized protein
MFLLLDIPYPLIVAGIFLLGIITGGLSNVTSGGAGIFTIFVLTNVAGISIQRANGTVLAASTIIVLVGVISFYRRGQVNTQLAITVGISGVVGAFFAARWASSIQSGMLERIFGAFTLALAFYTGYMFLSKWRKSNKKRKQVIEADSQNGGGGLNSNASAISSSSGMVQPVQAVTRFSGLDPISLSIQIAKGVLIGVATGLFGVGLASLSVVLFMVLFRLDTKLILGTSLLASFFRYFGGSVGYISAGQIDPFFFLIMVVGGGIGSVIGARIVLGKAFQSGSRDIYIQMLQVGILLFVSYEFLLKFLI